MFFVLSEYELYWDGVFKVILVKNSFELVCYSCASSLDARCQTQMTAYADLQQTCPSPNSSCTVILIAIFRQYNLFVFYITTCFVFKIGLLIKKLNINYNTFLFWDEFLSFKVSFLRIQWLKLLLIYIYLRLVYLYIYEFLKFWIMTWKIPF